MKLPVKPYSWLARALTRTRITNLIPPTSTVTSAVQTVVDTGKVRVSTTLYEPPGAWVALTCDMAKVKGIGVSFGMTMSDSIFNGGGVANEDVNLCDHREWENLHGKMYNSLAGMWSNAEIFTWKFFAITSLGTWASQSYWSCSGKDSHTDKRPTVRRKVESSLKEPESKTNKNSAPPAEVFLAWILDHSLARCLSVNETHTYGDSLQGSTIYLLVTESQFRQGVWAGVMYSQHHRRRLDHPELQCWYEGHPG